MAIFHCYASSPEGIPSEFPVPPCLAQAVDIFEGSNGGEAQRIVPEGAGVQPLADPSWEQWIKIPKDQQVASSISSIQKPIKNQQKDKLFQLYI